MIIPLIVVLVFSFFSIIATYLAVVEKDLLNSAIFMALQGVCYTLIYYVLLAPDVSLAYIPVSSGLLPILLLVVLRKLERFEP